MAGRSSAAQGPLRSTGVVQAARLVNRATSLPGPFFAPSVTQGCVAQGCVAQGCVVTTERGGRGARAAAWGAAGLVAVAGALGGESETSADARSGAAKVAFVEDFADGAKALEGKTARWWHPFAVAGDDQIKLDGASLEAGLHLPTAGKRYMISAPVPASTDYFSVKEDGSLVIQYTAFTPTDLTCSGAYIKALDATWVGEQKQRWGRRQTMTAKSDTPFTVMFGPDVCLPHKNTIQLILVSTNPSTGLKTEHFLSKEVNSSGMEAEKWTVYTAVVRKDNTFSVLVDGKTVVEGDLRKDFEPAFQPEEMWDDPEAFEPEDWDDEPEEYPDPDAKKPDSWDDRWSVPDPDAEMPEGWEEDAPEQIINPDAVEPDMWDEEEDGEWQPPLIDNPVCEDIGCGEWTPPTVQNPDYDGPWTPPLIPNPKYRGVWAANKVTNPNFVEIDNPAAVLNGVGGVMIELWVMEKGLKFSNFYLGSSEKEAAAHRQATWAPKSDLAAFSAIRAADIIEDDNLKAIKETLEESELSLENIALSLLVDQWIYLKKHHRWTFYPQVQPVLEFARDNHALYRHCGGRGSTSDSLCHLGPGEAGVWVFGQCSPCRYLA